MGVHKKGRIFIILRYIDRYVLQWQVLITQISLFRFDTHTTNPVDILELELDQMNIGIFPVLVVSPQLVPRNFSLV